MTGSLRKFCSFFYSDPFKKIVLSEVGDSPKMLYGQHFWPAITNHILILCEMRNLGPGVVQLQYHLGNEYKYNKTKVICANSKLEKNWGLGEVA